MLPGQSLRLFKFLGIPIEINLTWIIVFGIFAFAMITGFFPSVFPGRSFPVYFFLGIGGTFIFFGSIILHELAHTYIAVKNNLKVSRIILFLFGGISQMQGEVNEPKTEFKMAIVGPIVNFAIAIVLSLLAVILSSFQLDIIFVQPLIFFAQLNIFLAVFNLLPAFPLDGGRILRSAVWGITKNLGTATTFAARVGEVLAGVFLIGGLYIALQGSLINGIWVMLIGWFIGQAAISSYEHTRNLEAISGTNVRNIMTANLVRMPADITIQQAVTDYFVRYRYGRFPVEMDGHVIGVLTVADIDSVPREQWNLITVESIVEPVTEERKLSGDRPAEEAMGMIEQGASEVLVYEGNDLSGIVTKNDILKLAETKSKLQKAA